MSRFALPAILLAWFACLLTSCIAAVALLALQGWFGIGDLSAFVFWLLPFAFVCMIVALAFDSLSRSWRPGVRYLCGALVGFTVAFLWTWLVAILLGPLFRAFSFPILFCFMVGGACGVVVFLRLGSQKDALRRPIRPAAMLLVFVLTVLGLVPFFMGSESRVNQVHFVLPEGYRGSFAIKPDNPDGVELHSVDGHFVINIPEPGVLKIKGTDPFKSYLKTASFGNGEAIWVEKRLHDKPPQGAVGLWSVGSEGRYEGRKLVNRYWWFVGTEEEWRAADHEARYRVGRVVKKRRE